MSAIAEINPMYPVHTVDNQHFVQLPGGEHVLITLGGNPGQLPPGWRPLFVYAGFAPVYLLELKHEDGPESTWFLNERFERTAFDHPETLPAWELTMFRYRSGQILSRMWSAMLEGLEPKPDQEITGFLALGLNIRIRIASFSDLDFDVKLLPIDLQVARPASATVFHTRSGIQLDLGVIAGMLTTDLLKQSLHAIRLGRLDWQSPVDGRMLATVGGIWLTDFMYVYRVVIADKNLAFYVLASGHPCHVIGVVFPSERVVFTNGSEYVGHTINFYKAPIEVLLMRHLCVHGAEMMSAWRAGPSGFTALFRERLISGQLWHDLTGLDQLVREVPAEQIPQIMGMWGGVPEIYGDTEDIFPETSGKLVRSILDDRAMASHAYDQRKLVLRTTGYYVTKNLYSKLIRVSENDPALERSRVLAEEISRIGCPIVLLGLRVENRTVEDLPEFWSQVIDYLLLRCGQAAVVLDGHNTARGATPNLSFASEFQEHAKEEPIVAERRVVQALADRYKNKQVILINNIGGLMSQSIFWCHKSHFFVTMYGTGLAKYRWACNQTGLIVTSCWTLRHQPHLHIYEEEFLEEPSPLLFLPEQYVEDLPDSPQLVSEPGNPPARWNFKVNLDGLHAAIEELLQRNYLSSSPRS